MLHTRSPFSPPVRTTVEPLPAEAVRDDDPALPDCEIFWMPGPNARTWRRYAVKRISSNTDSQRCGYEAQMTEWSAVEATRAPGVAASDRHRVIPNGIHVVQVSGPKAMRLTWERGKGTTAIRDPVLPYEPYQMEPPRGRPESPMNDTLSTSQEPLTAMPSVRETAEERSSIWQSLRKALTALIHPVRVRIEDLCTASADAVRSLTHSPAGARPPSSTHLRLETFEDRLVPASPDIIDVPPPAYTDPLFLEQQESVIAKEFQPLAAERTQLSATVDTVSSAIAGRQAEEDALQIQIDTVAEAIAGKDGDIAAQDRIIAGFQADEDAAADAIARLSAQIEEKEGTLTGLQDRTAQLTLALDQNAANQALQKERRDDAQATIDLDDEQEAKEGGRGTATVTLDAVDDETTFTVSYKEMPVGVQLRLTHEEGYKEFIPLEEGRGSVTVTIPYTRSSEKIFVDFTWLSDPDAPINKERIYNRVRGGANKRDVVEQVSYPEIKPDPALLVSPEQRQQALQTIEDATSKLQELGEQRTKTENDLNWVNGEISSIEGEIADLQAEKAKEEGKLPGLDQKITEAKTFRGKLEKQKGNLEQQRDDLERQMDNVASLQVLLGRREEVDAEIQQVHGDIGLAEEHLKGPRGRQSTLTGNIDALEEQLRSKRGEKDQLNAQISDLNGRISTLDAKIDAQQEIIDANRAVLERAAAERAAEALRPAASYTATAGKKSKAITVSVKDMLTGYSARLLDEGGGTRAEQALPVGAGEVVLSFTPPSRGFEDWNVVLVNQKTGQRVSDPIPVKVYRKGTWKSVDSGVIVLPKDTVKPDPDSFVTPEEEAAAAKAVDDAQAAKEPLERERAPLAADLADLRKQCSQVQQFINDLNLDLGNKKDELANVQAEIETLEGELGALQTELSSLQGQRTPIDGLIQQREQERALLSAAQTILAEIAPRYETLKGQLSVIQAELSNLEPLRTLIDEPWHGIARVSGLTRASFLDTYWARDPVLRERIDDLTAASDWIAASDARLSNYEVAIAQGGEDRAALEAALTIEKQWHAQYEDVSEARDAMHRERIPYSRFHVAIESATEEQLTLRVRLASRDDRSFININGWKAHQVDHPGGTADHALTVTHHYDPNVRIDTSLEIGLFGGTDGSELRDSVEVYYDHTVPERAEIRSDQRDWRDLEVGRMAEYPVKPQLTMVKTDGPTAILHIESPFDASRVWFDGGDGYLSSQTIEHPGGTRFHLAQITINADRPTRKYFILLENGHSETLDGFAVQWDREARTVTLADPSAQWSPQHYLASVAELAHGLQVTGNAAEDALIALQQEAMDMEKAAEASTMFEKIGYLDSIDVQGTALDQLQGAQLFEASKYSVDTNRDLMNILRRSAYGQYFQGNGPFNETIHKEARNIAGKALAAYQNGIGRALEAAIRFCIDLRAGVPQGDAKVKFEAAREQEMNARYFREASADFHDLQMPSVEDLLKEGERLCQAEINRLLNNQAKAAAIRHRQGFRPALTADQVRSKEALGQATDEFFSQIVSRRRIALREEQMSDDDRERIARLNSRIGNLMATSADPRIVAIRDARKEDQARSAVVAAVFDEFAQVMLAGGRVTTFNEMFSYLSGAIAQAISSVGNRVAYEKAVEEGGVTEGTVEQVRKGEIAGVTVVGESVLDESGTTMLLTYSGDDTYGLITSRYLIAEGTTDVVRKIEPLTFLGSDLLDLRMRLKQDTRGGVEAHPRLQFGDRIEAYLSSLTSSQKGDLFALADVGSDHAARRTGTGSTLPDAVPSAFADIDAHVQDGLMEELWSVGKDVVSSALRREMLKIGKDAVFALWERVGQESPDLVGAVRKETALFTHLFKNIVALALPDQSPELIEKRTEMVDRSDIPQAKLEAVRLAAQVAYDLAQIHPKVYRHVREIRATVDQAVAHAAAREGADLSDSEQVAAYHRSLEQRKIFEMSESLRSGPGGRPLMVLVMGNFQELDDSKPSNHTSLIKTYYDKLQSSHDVIIFRVGNAFIEGLNITGVSGDYSLHTGVIQQHFENVIEDITHGRGLFAGRQPPTKVVAVGYSFGGDALDELFAEWGRLGDGVEIAATAFIDAVKLGLDDYGAAVRRKPNHGGQHLHIWQGNNDLSNIFSGGMPFHGGSVVGEGSLVDKGEYRESHDYENNVHEVFVEDTNHVLIDDDTREREDPNNENGVVWNLIEQLLQQTTEY